MLRFPDIKLIQNNENLGYCGGNNVGIKEANGEFVVILNPDTEVDPNWMDGCTTMDKQEERIFDGGIEKC